MKGNLIVTIMGPTGVGKTDLAIELCSHFPISIISVDSVQIYKHLDIGSGKPSKDLLQSFPHDLIDIVEPTEPYSTAQFQKDALKSIKDSFEGGKIPILVGGTMMYFNHLIDGISRLPKVSQDIRSDIEREFEKNGSQKMHDYLKTIDLKSSEKIHINDSQRIKRAIEVFKATGKGLSQWQEEKKKEVSKTISNSNLQQISLIPESRTLHRELILRRFNQMISDGLIEEVEKILNLEGMSSGSQSMKSIGYRQVCKYLDGDYGLDDMIEKSVNATRQLAKRQMTWLNNWNNLKQISAKESPLKTLVDLIKKNT